MNLWELLLAFLEGLALILSPCILPVLPVIFSTGLQGGNKRPYGVITGFICAFWFFTLLSRKLVVWLGIDPEILRQISLVLLLSLGIVLTSSVLSRSFLKLTQGLSNAGQELSNFQGGQNGYWSGLLIGICIGLIWTPCAGPIIAAVIVQTIRQTSDLQSALLLGAFSIGAGLPMLLITIGGKKVVGSVNFFKTRTVLLRKGMGVILILTVVATALQGQLALYGGFGRDAKMLRSSIPGSGLRLENGLEHPYMAPELAGSGGWINTTPLTLRSLRGKVVLIDFWTYSCINCIRTLPYLKRWDQTYRQSGLVIIGVHSPEFEFEKKLANVQAAVRANGIAYPVMLDNELATFTGFNSIAWPAHYLIDREGRVIYIHNGEGNYDITENNIRYALGLKDRAKLAETGPVLYPVSQTPELYLGYRRAQEFISPVTPQRDEVTEFSAADPLPVDHWTLAGPWLVNGQFITAQSSASLFRLHFNAGKVYLVAGAQNGKSVRAHIRLNGQPISAEIAGRDVHNGSLTIDGYRLYELVHQPKPSEGVLEIQPESPGLAAYSFTFGP